MENYIQKIKDERNRYIGQLEKCTTDDEIFDENIQHNINSMFEYMENLHSTFLSRPLSESEDEQNECYWCYYLPEIWMHNMLHFMLLEIFDSNTDTMHEYLEKHMESLTEIIEEDME